MLADRMATPNKITPKKQKDFLDILSQIGSITKACEHVKISRNSFYNFRKKNKKFAEEWEEAEKRGVDGLIEEARRRAYGTEELLLYDKERKEVKIRSKYSDNLLMFLIKAKRPEYRESYQMNVGGDLTIKVVKFTDGSKAAKQLSLIHI